MAWSDSTGVFPQIVNKVVRFTLFADLRCYAHKASNGIHIQSSLNQPTQTQTGHLSLTAFFVIFYSIFKPYFLSAEALYK